MFTIELKNDTGFHADHYLVFKIQGGVVHREDFPDDMELDEWLVAVGLQMAGDLHTAPWRMVAALSKGLDI